MMMKPKSKRNGDCIIFNIYKRESGAREKIKHEDEISMTKALCERARAPALA